MEKYKLLKKIIERIREYISSVIRKDNSYNKNKSNIKSIDDREVIKNKEDNDIRFASIYQEQNLKALDKFYLMYIIDNYDPHLGYVEISNTELMKAANCKNNNTVIDVINRLCDKKFIRKLEVSKGHTNRYLILRNLECLEQNDDNKFKNINKKSDKFIEASGNMIEQEAIEKIMSQNKIIEEACKDIVKRIEVINSYINKPIKQQQIELNNTK